MSGHSHWKTIKYKKGTADAQRGKVFSKLSRLIAAAVRQGGPNPDFNAKLKLAVEQARSFNMPGENVERAIERARGAAEGETLEELLLEGFGPQQSALLIFAITNNKNRTVGEVRRVLAPFGGKLGETGSVRWLFEQKGVVEISKEKSPSLSSEEIELRAIEAGASDVQAQNGFIVVYADPQELEAVKTRLSGVPIESASIDWVAKSALRVPPEKLDNIQKLIGELDELEDVQDVYTNVTFDA